MVEVQIAGYSLDSIKKMLKNEGRDGSRPFLHPNLVKINDDGKDLYTILIEERRRLRLAEDKGAILESFQPEELTLSKRVVLETFLKQRELFEPKKTAYLDRQIADRLLKVSTHGFSIRKKLERRVQNGGVIVGSRMISLIADWHNMLGYEIQLDLGDSTWMGFNFTNPKSHHVAMDAGVTERIRTALLLSKSFVTDPTLSYHARVDDFGRGIPKRKVNDTSGDRPFYSAGLKIARLEP